MPSSATLANDVAIALLLARPGLSARIEAYQWFANAESLALENEKNDRQVRAVAGDAANARPLPPSKRPAATLSS